MDGVARMHRWRVPLTAAFVGAALALSRPETTVDLLAPGRSPRAWTIWALLLTGATVRLWGAGNLRKNQEVTTTGVYRLVRHPLYLGTLLLLLGFFWSLLPAPQAVGLWAALTIGVFGPTMLHEERELAARFPEQARAAARLPRLLPDLRRLPEALATDRFSWMQARRNLGLRAFLFVALLPPFLRLWTALRAEF
jgi:protein-S-isoprenylcysteine O-methyltransferase Ste14